MRKVLYIYIFKATSAPPRAGPTGIVLHVFNTYICILISRYFMCLYIYIYFFNSNIVFTYYIYNTMVVFSVFI